MHPILTKRERLIFYLGVWLVIAGLLAGMLVASGVFGWARAFLLTIPMTLFYSFVTLSAIYVCRAFPVGRTSVFPLVGVQLLAALFSAALWILFGLGFTFLLSGIDASIAMQFERTIPLFLGIGVLLFVLSVALHYLLMTFEASRAVERQALQFELLARESELKALRAQIHPHFLFNSLNSISALITASPTTARAMLLQLSEFLRLTLVTGTKETVTFREELDLVDAFLSIEKMRFGDRLLILIDVEEEANRCVVPPLLLQPLLENAVNHGIAHLIEGGAIALRARHLGSRLKITVTNPYDPDMKSHRRNGLGLQNVKQRLASLYGSEARLDIERIGEHFHVEINLPVGEER